MLLPLHRAACCQLSPFPSRKWSLVTAIALSLLAPGRFGYLQLLRALSLYTAAFLQRSLLAVFSHVVVCTSFHLFLVSLHRAAFISFCLFTVPRTWFLLAAFTFLPLAHSCFEQCPLIHGLRLAAPSLRRLSHALSR